MNGDGEILEEIGFDLNEIRAFDELNNANNEIETCNQQFSALESQSGTYDIMMYYLKERVDYSNIDFTIRKNGDESSIYKLSNIINTINTQVTPEWRFSCNEGENCYDPRNIENDNKCNGYSGELQKNCKRIEGIIKLVKIANNEEGDSPNNFKAKTDGLDESYNTFLGEEQRVMDLYQEKINDLISILFDYIGNDGVFGFINCKFVGNNIIVILNNIKECLGTDFYTVGICLLIDGCSMGVSICFTIILIIIINKSVDQNKKEEGTKTIP